MHDQFLTFILCGVRLTWTKSWIETTIIIIVAGLILDIKLIFYRQCQTTLSFSPIKYINIALQNACSFS